MVSRIVLSVLLTGLLQLLDGKVYRSIALFHSKNLRLHDNPVLFRNSEIVPVYFEKEIEPALFESVSSLRKTLQSRGTDMHLGLTSFISSGAAATADVDTLLYSPHSAKIDASIVATCKEAGINLIKCTDTLLGASEEQQLQIQLNAAKELADLSFLSAEKLYSGALQQRVLPPNMVAHSAAIFHTASNVAPPSGSGRSASTPEAGETLALSLIKQYINLGEDGFTRKFASVYIDSISQSSELRRSLIRLLPNDRNSDMFLNRGEVIAGLLAPLITQGCVSPRLLVHARRAMPGWISKNELPRGVESLQACPLRQEAVRKHWHANLAAGVISKRSAWTTKFDSWRGFLYRHGAMAPQSGASEYAFVLLHGFGGSIDQFTALGEQLCARGHTCHALDSLGFGSCEKPPLSYNQYLWRDHALEYIASLRESGAFDAKKVVLVGNSIGGFAAASSAAVLGQACHGLVLLNSAGRMMEEDPNPSDSPYAITPEPPDADFLFPPYTGPQPWQLSIFGKIIFSLLQPNIERTTTWLYPVNPQHVKTSNLAKNILRDSLDPGASEVIAAGGKLPTPRSMDGLFSDFGGPILIAQGAKDPLNDAPARAAMFGRISDRVTVDLLDLGHCPFDENGALVAQSIDKWLTTVYSR